MFKEIFEKLFRFGERLYIALWAADGLGIKEKLAQWVPPVIASIGSAIWAFVGDAPGYVIALVALAALGAGLFVVNQAIRLFKLMRPAAAPQANLAAAPEVKKEPSEPASKPVLRGVQTPDDAPEPDEWLVSAVRLMVWGQWKAPVDTASTESRAHTFLHDTNRCLVRMRQLAHTGKLHIWGKSDPARLPDLISQSYWNDHQIEILSVIDGRDEWKATTERTANAGSSVKYEHLQINAQEVESRWFIALPEVAKQAYENTRGTHAAKASEILHGDGSAGVLGWYANALLSETFAAIPLFGRRPPSTRMERISPSVLRGAAISDDAATLTEMASGRLIYKDLSTIHDGLEQRIAEIRRWN